MTKNNYKNMGILILTGLLLLAVRIVFFLKDGTNDTIEILLFIMIYIVSIITLLYYSKQKIDNVTKFINQYFDKFVFVVFLVSMEITFKLSMNNGFSFIYIFSLLLGISLITLFTILIPKKISKWTTLLLGFIYFVYVIGQDIYGTIFTGLFSFRDSVNIGEGADFATGVYTFKITHIIYTLLFITFIIFTVKQKEVTHIKITKKNIFQIIEVPFLLFLCMNMNAVYPVKSARLHTSDHYLFSSNFDSSRLASRYSLLNLFYRDLGAYILPSFGDDGDVEFIEEYFETIDKNHQVNEYTGMFEGKNVIFILAESYDELALSEELTPNIYRIKTEGLDFQNHYTPVYPRTTCDTEVIINTGLVPSINDGPTCYEFNQNQYDNSLAALYNNEDYTTKAFHSNYSDFYTRNLVYNGFEYDQFFGQIELDMTDIDKRYDSIFAEKLENDIHSEETYFSFVITLSGHSPYQDSNLAGHEHYDVVDDYYGDSLPESVKYYIATQIEIDMFLGEILDQLAERNSLDDTVIVFTGDHYPYTLNQADFESVTGRTNVHDKQQGALYIWNPTIEDADIQRLSSTFDIIPTLSNLFGLDANYNEYVGNDIFDTTQTPLVLFKDYYVYDGDQYYDLTAENSEIDDELYTLANKYYKLSINILKSDYYNKTQN